MRRQRGLGNRLGRATVDVDLDNHIAVGVGNHDDRGGNDDDGSDDDDPGPDHHHD